MPDKLFKDFVDETSRILRCVFGIADRSGLILACSDKDREGGILSEISDLTDSAQDGYMTIDGVSYLEIKIKKRVQYIIFIGKDSEDSRQILELAALTVKNIKLLDEDRFDKAGLLKSIIMGSLHPGEIAARAKKLQMDREGQWEVFLINAEKASDVYPPDVIRNLFPDRSRNFIIDTDDGSTVLIRHLRAGDSREEAESTAKIIVDTLNTELMIKAAVSIGTAAFNIGDIGRSFREAQTARQVGETFENDKTVFSYENLGLGRLIYQLPVELCRLFINEVFRENTLDSLEPEIMLTIQQFFENSLNISETSRQMYIHRNTLVYRLDKIRKLTGLDLRKFDDAILFKVSMLVKRYLDKKDTQDNN